MSELLTHSDKEEIMLTKFYSPHEKELCYYTNILCQAT